MRAIVLVAEIILDNAKVFFRDGWEQRGERVREERRRQLQLSKKQQRVACAC
jgi:hypothetical protein